MKRLFVSLLAGFLLLMSACSGSSDINADSNGSSNAGSSGSEITSAAGYTELSAPIEYYTSNWVRADVFVKGRVSDVYSKEIVWYTDPLSGEEVLFNYNFYTFEILESYYGDLSAGDKITVQMPNDEEKSPMSDQVIEAGGLWKSGDVLYAVLDYECNSLFKGTYCEYSCYRAYENNTVFQYTGYKKDIEKLGSAQEYVEFLKERVLSAEELENRKNTAARQIELAEERPTAPVDGPVQLYEEDNKSSRTPDKIYASAFVKGKVVGETQKEVGLRYLDSKNEINRMVNYNFYTFEILESYFGDLKPGDTVTVQMANDLSRPRKSISEKLWHTDEVVCTVLIKGNDSTFNGTYANYSCYDGYSTGGDFIYPGNKNDILGYGNESKYIEHIEKRLVEWPEE